MKRNQPPQPNIYELTALDREVVSRLTESITKLEGQIRARKTVIDLTDEINTLKTQLADLNIQKSQRDEEFGRKERETEHKIGLAQTQFESEKANHVKEQDLAKREAVLAVKSENLQAERDQFKQHIEFVEAETAAHMSDMKSLLEQIMERIPTVNVGIKQSNVEKS